MDPVHYEANQKSWDALAGLHAADSTGSYRIDRVIGGRSCLHRIEATELGDVRGLRVAHLQCHIGLDTLSIAHLGAEVVGLDFSETAVAAARDFARRAGRPDVQFVAADVHDARAVLTGSFDRVFVTWGAICWLPDIRRWAGVVASLLKPGGRLVLAEGHPVTLCLEERDGRLEARYDWHTPIERPLMFEEANSYTGETRPPEHRRSYEWIHPLGAIFGALFDAGLGLRRFAEHEVVPWKLFPMAVPTDLDEDGTPTAFRLPDDVPRLPLSFSLTAEKITSE